MAFPRKNKSFALGRLKAGAMNKTEAAYSERLQLRQIAGEVVWYKFEGIKLRLANATFYSPDFAVTKSAGGWKTEEF